MNGKIGFYAKDTEGFKILDFSSLNPINYDNTNNNQKFSEVKKIEYFSNLCYEKYYKNSLFD